MNKPTVFEVTDEIRRQLPGIRCAKLQALLYYCQACYVRRHGTAMFDEAMEAWRRGPVVPTVWRSERYRRPQPSCGAVSSQAQTVIDDVCSRFGGLSDQELAERVQSEQPWLLAWEGRSLNSLAEPITVEGIQAHYSPRPIELAAPETPSVVEPPVGRARRLIAAG